MKKIKHAKGGVKARGIADGKPFKIFFPKGEAVEVDESVAKKLLKNPDFQEMGKYTTKRAKFATESKESEE